MSEVQENIKEQIAKNAQEFYITYLTQSGIVNAFANTLHTLATTIGTLQLLVEIR